MRHVCHEMKFGRKRCKWDYAVQKNERAKMVAQYFLLVSCCGASEDLKCFLFYFQYAMQGGCFSCRGMVALLQ